MALVILKLLRRLKMRKIIISVAAISLLGCSAVNARQPNYIVRDLAGNEIHRPEHYPPLTDKYGKEIQTNYDGRDPLEKYLDKHHSR